jgi:hypothetical protein
MNKHGEQGLGYKHGLSFAAGAVVGAGGLAGAAYMYPPKQDESATSKLKAFKLMGDLSKQIVHAQQLLKLKEHGDKLDKHLAYAQALLDELHKKYKADPGVDAFHSVMHGVLVQLIYEAGY